MKSNILGTIETDTDFLDGVFDNTLVRNSPFEEGVITSTDPKSYTACVSTNNGDIPYCRIGTPYLPAVKGGFSSLPEAGTRCLVCTATEIPTIICFIVEPNDSGSSIETSPISKGTEGFGGQDPTYQASQPIEFRAGQRNDLLPGEICVESADGNLLAILRGLSVLKGAELSQIIACNTGNLLRLISGWYQHFHSAGYTEIKQTEDNSVNFFVSLGTENVDGEHFQQRVTVSIGSEAEVLEVKIYSEEGEEKTRFHIGEDGEVFVDISEDFIFSVRGSTTLSFTGEVGVSMEQPLSAELSNTNLEIDGSLQVSSSGNIGMSTASNMTILAGSNMNTVVNGQKIDTVFKKEIHRNFKEFEHKISGEEYSIGVYSDQAAAIQKGGISITDAGIAQMTSTDLCSLESRTLELRGDSVLLGKSPIKQPVIRQTDLEKLADSIVALINATAVTPSGPVVIPYVPGVNPLSATIKSLGSKTTLSE